MTGAAFFPTDTERDFEDAHAVQWVGTAAVKGPRWARLPLLTVGMLGIQCVWSIEMGYASPYLLELGLSKSFMSLVFMAGPLSGLIVQPLVGIFADRSRSALGRRRPFMLAGCAICVSAMMLLGWTREIAGFFGAGQWMAIALAVWAIYCVDFSINAVMSTDRALVVDTLPPKEQEEGSAWAGRMFGFGSVAGFWVGTLDLTGTLPWLGKTQLQILSFITSVILMVTHTFTSWAVSERVLLRDDRPQSQSGLKSNLKAIWDNMFSLPTGIRTVCLIQFFASLGWFPILFFTTVWVSEIYKASVPSEGIDQAVFESDAVRSGSRALLLQALVNIATSIGMPFLVSESGVQAEAQTGGEYAPIGLGINGTMSEAPLSSATWNRTRQDLAGSSFTQKTIIRLRDLLDDVKSGEWGLPIKGLTLVRVWWVSQFVFAGAMAASWFVTTVHGAYAVIATTGFCWALSQWAPYSLLGELILIDGTAPRDETIGLAPMASSEAGPIFTLFQAREEDEEEEDSTPLHRSDISSRSTPLHSRYPSRTSPNPSRGPSRPPSPDEKKPKGHRPQLSLSLQSGLSPLVIQGEQPVEPPLGSTVVLRHSDDFSSSSPTTPPSHLRHSSTSSHFSRAGRDSPEAGAEESTADKAGVILGIHNVFLVLPQFIVTVLSAVIFWLMEPDRTLPVHHPGTVPMTNTTAAAEVEDAVGEILKRGLDAWKREIEPEVSSSDAVGLIFRIGGVSAAIGGWICWKMARDWKKGKGL
ncbi:hypothetical protein L202_04886, partial [Cryptococcus amylolentus CBS 6039]